MEPSPFSPERFSIDRDLLCTADSDGRFTSLNEAWERVLGWPREELMGRPFIEFVHPDDREATVRVSARVAEAGYELVDFQNRYRTQEGEYRWLRWSARSDGRLWFAVAVDVTAEVGARRRLALLLDEKRFLAYAQPIAAAGLRRRERYELLIRLSPERDGGLPILPVEFIPAAEQLGLVGVVDRWMLERALEEVGAGRVVQVNISQETLTDETLVDELLRMIAATPRPRDAVIFELTETAAVHSIEAVKDFTERAGKLGCRFALDDWGTGYGSLSLLRELDISYLKIDGSLVSGATSSRTDRALLRGVIGFASGIGLRTVAEGVEDSATLKLLEELGVDDVQGYAIGRPRPLEAAAL